MFFAYIAWFTKSYHYHVFLFPGHVFAYRHTHHPLYRNNAPHIANQRMNEPLQAVVQFEPHLQGDQMRYINCQIDLRFPALAELTRKRPVLYRDHLEVYDVDLANVYLSYVSTIRQAGTRLYMGDDVFDLVRFRGNWKLEEKARSDSVRRRIVGP